MSDAENTTREKVMLTVREKAHRAVSSVLFNASNYPERVQARILGQDTQPLTEKVVDALIAAFPTLTSAPTNDNAAEHHLRSFAKWVGLMGDEPLLDIAVEVSTALERVGEGPYVRPLNVMRNAAVILDEAINDPRIPSASPEPPFAVPGGIA